MRGITFHVESNDYQAQISSIGNVIYKNVAPSITEFKQYCLPQKITNNVAPSITVKTILLTTKNS